MTVLVVITYRTHFSNEVVEYFKQQNIYNSYKFTFLPIGLDGSKEEHIVSEIHKRLSTYNNLSTVVIISDAGLPTKVAKKISIKDPEVKVLRSKGSLIENGFLTYIMLNTKAPFETIEMVVEEKIDKD